MTSVTCVTFCTKTFSQWTNSSLPFDFLTALMEGGDFRGILTVQVFQGQWKTPPTQRKGISFVPCLQASMNVWGRDIHNNFAPFFVTSLTHGCTSSRKFQETLKGTASDWAALIPHPGPSSKPENRALKQRIPNSGAH